MATGKMRMVTAKTSVNIAVIKYWGKVPHCDTLILPINDSMSGTLDSSDLCTITSVAVDESFTRDRMWLNGEEVDMDTNKRLTLCLQEVRAKCADKSLASFKIRIASVNDFPTAAGLASSAAGYAALIYALGHLFGITDKATLSVYARMGSGSAIRSLDGGFVHWIKGDGSSDSSIAKQIVDHTHWPEMRVLILVVNDAKKENASTDAMKRSVDTSSLINHRASVVVPERIKLMTRAIITKDFDAFAELTMKDSNQFHAIALDSFPPIKYMDETSWQVIRMVHGLNSFHGKNVAAYTFDAGPNACIYLLEETVQLFLQLTLEYFPFSDRSQCIRGQSIANKDNIPLQPSDDLRQHLANKAALRVQTVDSLKYIIATRIGKGAEIDSSRSLLDSAGNPIGVNV